MFRLQYLLCLVSQNSALSWTRTLVVFLESTNSLGLFTNFSNEHIDLLVTFYVTFRFTNMHIPDHVIILNHPTFVWWVITRLFSLRDLSPPHIWLIKIYFINQIICSVVPNLNIILEGTSESSNYKFSVCATNTFTWNWKYNPFPMFR